MILIDTHVWIWFHTDPDKFSASSLELLQTTKHLALSTLSIYETMVAVEKGRLASPIAPEALVRKWLSATDITRIAVSEEIVVRSRSLQFQHGDPFDRMIAATAVQEKAPLMTADRNLLQLEWLETIPIQ